LIRFGTRNGGNLLEGSRRTIDIDFDGIDQAGISPTGTDSRQVLFQFQDCLFHAILDIEKNFVSLHNVCPSFNLLVDYTIVGSLDQSDENICAH
jgi:hypothetical protein